MMLKKEREVIFMVEKHLDDIKEWLKASFEALSSYLSDDVEKIRHLALGKSETTALLQGDRQAIWGRLCRGAYFPAIRGDLFGIVTGVGAIAEAATASCETFWVLQPEMPLEIKNPLASTVRQTSLLFRPIHESVLYYLRGDDVLKVVGKNVDLVLQQRAKIDASTSDLKKQIFSSALDGFQKLQLNDCLQSIAAVSARAGEANDKIQLVMVKIIA